ncbi:hypothetical protein Poli38472_001316 [Pythium oligandrum]|uniref:Alcohol dehydrogenase-like N-terminal domain-containing protein n=1 Tax=Pythium oligandrum TaxID=41045 RepID=A0A8K1CT82_PYTOL|nr:hypothetical protein Poli38472_001316 [Pythium oligandrum]|eukprot:TMW69160.1 hypothetical protein Poli38472_001316 [Pythium oligandrum]
MGAHTLPHSTIFCFQATPSPSEPPFVHHLGRSIPTTYRAFEYVEHSATRDKLILNNATPQEPLASTQVCIQVHSASDNPADWKVLEWSGALFGLPLPTKEKPFGIGFDAAGVIVEVEADAKTLKVGDEVYIMTPFNKFGSIREYLTAEEKSVAPKPANIS